MAGAGTDAPPPVLYLLHGLSDDDTIWLRRTSIERYVAEFGLAVVMPQVHRSFYLDGEYTGAYWTFVAEELPALVAGFFRVSQAREDTFVAGLSMGGYGAMLHALRQPGRFAAAASLSGALDVGAWAEGGDPHGLLRTIAGGRSLAGTDADLLTLLDRADVGRPAAAVRAVRDRGRAGGRQPEVRRAGGGRRGERDLRVRPRHARVGLLGPDHPRRAGLAAAQASMRRSASRTTSAAYSSTIASHAVQATSSPTAEPAALASRP